MFFVDFGRLFLPEGVPAFRGWAPSPEGLLWLAVLLFHFALPLHSDVTLFIILIALGALWVRAKTLRPFSPPPPVRVAFLGGGLYLAAALVATALHPQTTSAASRILLWVCCLYGGWIAGMALPGQRYRYLGALALSLILSALVGGAEGLVAGSWADLWHANGMKLKLFATTSARLAVYCGCALLWSLHGCLTQKKCLQGVQIGFFAVLLILLFLTNNRAALGALAVGLLFFFFLEGRKAARKFVGLFVGALGIGIALTVFFPDLVNPQRLRTGLVEGVQDRTFQSRLPIWEAACASFLEAPVFGNGIKSFPELHAAYRAAHEEEWKVRHPGFEATTKSPHNLLLGRLVETGATGALGMLVLFGAVLYCALKGEPGDRWIAAVLIFFLAAGVWDDLFSRLNDSFVFFTAGAILGGYAAFSAKKS